MAVEEVKPYSDIILEETIFPLCSPPKNRNIHEVTARLTVSDMGDRYNISLVNQRPDEML
jgi:hypothetical protein